MVLQRVKAKLENQMALALARMLKVSSSPCHIFTESVLPDTVFIKNL